MRDSSVELIWGKSSPDSARDRVRESIVKVVGNENSEAVGTSWVTWTLSTTVWPLASAWRELEATLYRGVT